MKSKYLLVVGAEHSGTSLLATLLGGHKDINMLSEDFHGNVKKLIGKKYRGNKLIYIKQIMKMIRANRVTHLLNRFIKVFPKSNMSIFDFMDLDSKIIVIKRDSKENIKSLIKRNGYDKRLAEKYIIKCNKDLTFLTHRGLFYPYFLVTLKDLTSSKRCLKDICNYLEIDYDPGMVDSLKNGYPYFIDYGDKIIKKE
jgi:hypothetical protein